MPECFFAHYGGCQGGLVKAHLIPKQRVRREVLSRARARGELPPDIYPILWDERVWTWMCGGISGLAGHHGLFDARRIEVAYKDLPAGLVEFAREHGLEWSLERDYA